MERHILDVSEKPTRRRKGSRKSRDGCSECRRRRIKCDETLPSCRNCQKSRLDCPGPRCRPLRWSTKYEQHQQQTAHLGDMERGNEANTHQDDSHTYSHTPKPSARMMELGHNFSDADICLPNDYLGSQPAQVHETMNDALPGDIIEFDLLGILEPQNSESCAGPDLNALSIYTPPANLTDRLILHWFRYICPMWSIFDSDINFNRSVAHSTWTTSRAVFSTLQVMSAACLANETSEVRLALPALRTAAEDSITKAVTRIHVSPSPQVPIDLVFAVFGFGTSTHWTDTPTNGFSWLQSARQLLTTWKLCLSTLDAPWYAYFSDALTYWEMLAIATGCYPAPDGLERKRVACRGRVLQAIDVPHRQPNGNVQHTPPSAPNIGQRMFGARPSSWCGVSPEVVDLFGQVLSLCHSHRRRRNDHRGADLTVSISVNALCDIWLAREMLRDLTDMDFGDMILTEEAQGFVVHTQDEKTPISHLVRTAEAYRQAALLQLYMTFPDLRSDSGSLDDSSCAGVPNGDDEKSQRRFLLSLTLKLVDTLMQIPTQSGSLSKHVILYLAAAAGLRFDSTCLNHPHEDEISSLNDNDSQVASAGLFDLFCWDTEQTTFLHNNAPYPMTHLNSRDSNDTHSVITATSNVAPEPTQTQARDSIPISHTAAQISRARDFVSSRLSAIQRLLPHRTSDSSLKFARHLWAEYDSWNIAGGVYSTTNSPTTHWLDVMQQRGGGILLG